MRHDYNYTMSSLFKQFSSKENLRKAFAYVQNDLADSSFPADPLYHPAITAINSIGDSFFSALESYLRGGKYKPEKGFFVYAPDDNLELRPICILPLIDRIVYQAIFNQNIFGRKIDDQLSNKACFANRISRDETSGFYFNSNLAGWKKFYKTQKRYFEKGYVWTMEFGLQRFYEQIPISGLINKLKNDFGINDDAIISILNDQLCAWAEHEKSPNGLPQELNPSAVLGNVFLFSLDKYAGEELSSNKLRYLRYADRIILMGKSEEAVLKSAQKITEFLLRENIATGGKSIPAKLEDAKLIEAAWTAADYESDGRRMTKNDISLIQNKAANTLALIAVSKKIENGKLQELKCFLKFGTRHDTDFLSLLLEIIPLCPSLTVPIVRYVGMALNIPVNTAIPASIDSKLWEIYERKGIPEWSRFWIFKLLASISGIPQAKLDNEINRVLQAKDNSLLKVVAFYHQAAVQTKIDADQIKRAVTECKTDIEKSIFSFFLIYAYQDGGLSAIGHNIETLLDDASQELNLIGVYFYKNNPKAVISNFHGDFSNSLLKLPGKQGRYFLIREEDLIEISASSLPSVLGLARPIKNKRTVNLNLPEPIQWEKVTIKFQIGMQDVEILYDDKHIITASYIELGFNSAKTNHKPDRKWNFLEILAALQATDISRATTDNIKSSMAKRSGKTMGVANVYQTKKQLSDSLKTIFHTDKNPFTDNKEYYEPKFKVLPSSDTRLRSEKIWPQSRPLNENKYCKEKNDDKYKPI